MLLSHHQNDQNWNIKNTNRLSEHVSVQIFGKDNNKSKPYSGGN
jgi:hypothetical protein